MRPNLIVPGVIILLLAGVVIDAPDAKAASIEGKWSGSGTVTLKTGEKEPVRCRLSYEKSAGRTFTVSANCAHANGTFQQDGRVVQTGDDSYSGRLYNDQYSVAGDVSIAVNGSRQTVTAVSEKGRATLILNK